MRVVVHARPGARMNQVTPREDGSLLVLTTAAAERGKANEAVMALVADYYGIAKSQVRIVLGRGAREKLVDPDQKFWNTFIEVTLEWAPKLRKIYDSEGVEKVNLSG